MDKQNVVYPYSEYYSAIKRNKLSRHVKTGRNLKIKSLSARSQSKKDAYFMIPTI